MALFDWRSKLLEAKFRTVTFFVDSSETSPGRRNVVHEYPFKDEAHVEDMGEAANRYTLNCHIIQTPPLFNYFKQRNALIDAFNEEGFGILKHPYLGEKVVSVVGQPTIRETFSEGGIARFTVTFVETSPNIYPTVQPDLVGALDGSVLGAISSAVDTFAEIYSSVAANLSEINAGLNMIKSTIQAVKNLPSAAVSTAIAFIDNVISTAGALLDSPCDLAEELAGAFDLFVTLGQSSVQNITGSCTDRLIKEPFSNSVDGIDRAAGTTITTTAGIALIDSVLKLNQFGEAPDSSDASTIGGTLTPIIINSPTTAALGANQAILIDMNRLSGIAQATKLAVRIDYSNRIESENILNIIVTEIDDLIDYLANQAADTSYQSNNVNFYNDDIYSNLMNMKAQFVISMQQLGATLADIEEYQVNAGTQSVLGLSYDKYTDLTRSDEIITRNTNITHPGFLPNLEVIELLSQ